MDFYPMFYSVKFKANRGKFEHIADNIFLQIKKKFGFEHFEITKKEVIFSSGFPIVSCTISEDFMKLTMLLPNGETPYSSLNELIEQINSAAQTTINEVVELELGNVMNFIDMENVYNFYLNSTTAEEFGDFNEVYFAWRSILNDDDVEFVFKTGKSGKGYCYIRLDKELKFNDKDGLTKKLQEYQKELINLLNTYLKKRSVSFQQGVIIND